MTSWFASVHSHIPNYGTIRRPCALRTSSRRCLSFREGGLQFNQTGLALACLPDAETATRASKVLAILVSCTPYSINFMRQLFHLRCLCRCPGTSLTDTNMPYVFTEYQGVE